MPTILVYLVKTILCSAVLYSIYYFAFRNKANHQWSRFFLLATTCISITLPLISIDVPVAQSSDASAAVKLLSVVSAANIENEPIPGIANSGFPVMKFAYALYFSVSFLMLFMLAKRLTRLYVLYRSSPRQRLQNLNIVVTSEKNTPFSLFNVIFWNSRISLSSELGQKILEHEKVHVIHIHSADRLLMSVVLILCWYNPLFWLINNELITVHEFIADDHSIHDKNPETLSTMLLAAAFPTHQFHIISTFFNSSIKRRLSMLTTFKNAKGSHLAKWLMLPVLFILFAAFTLRKKQATHHLVSTFTVVVDAGHGGDRSGVVAADGTKEKDLNLLIAKKIQSLNNNSRIKIVMTRETDEDIPLRDRVETATKSNAGAFISIHINNDPSGQSGIQVMMTKNSNAYAAKSQVLGSLLSAELKNVYTVDSELKKGPADRGVWVLDAPEINYPSLLIECGNMQNINDREFVKSPANQQKIAEHILNAIEQFAAKNQ